MLSRKPFPARPLCRPPLWPIRLLFGLEALAFALLLPRFPDLKAGLGLGEAAFGVALLGLPAGTLVGLLIAPAAVRRVGPRGAAGLSVATLAAAIVLPGAALSHASLLGGFIVCGIAISHTEIALNTYAGHIEAATGRRILSGCHGIWSIGSIAGVLAGGAMGGAEVGVFGQSAGAAALIAAGAALLARSLPEVRTAPPPARAGIALPPAAVLPLCLLPVGIMVIEGIFMDWAAIFLRTAVEADPFAASLGFAAFAAAMAAVRLGGDRLAARFGDRHLVVVSSLAAGAGTLVFALAGSLPEALLGAALAGAGTAVIYPLALSAAARAPGRPETNIAAVSFTSFFVLMGSPAAFGFLAATEGYRTAVAASAALALPALLLSRRLRAGAAPAG